MAGWLFGWLAGFLAGWLASYVRVFISFVSFVCLSVRFRLSVCHVYLTICLSVMSTCMSVCPVCLTLCIFVVAIQVLWHYFFNDLAISNSNSTQNQIKFSEISERMNRRVSLILGDGPVCTRNGSSGNILERELIAVASNSKTEV